MKALLALVGVVAILWLTEPWWYAPVVRVLPEAGLILPQPSSYRPPAQPSPSATAGLVPPLVTLGPDPAAPTPLPIPSPAPTLSPAVAWSGSQCVDALTILASDHDLDSAAITEYPADAAYYTLVAEHWQIAYDAVSALCNGAAPGGAAALVDGDHLTSTGCTEPVAWFTAARLTHVDDLAVHPGNAAWDSAWESRYSALLALWAVPCG